MSKQFYEHSLWRMMKNHCPDYITLDRVEAKMPLGLPDVQGHSDSKDYGLFQIELKAIDQWPLVTTKLGVRPEQRYYLNKKGQKNQRVFLFVKVDDEYLLIKGSDVGDWFREDWERKALGIWYKQVDWKRFYFLIYS